MLKTLASGLLVSTLIISVSAAANDNEFPRCNCEDEGFFSVENILEAQRVSDLLIAIAYFSIPIELIYFVSCSNVPFKWVLFQFIAFIVLCGLTHLLNVWTYSSHPFQIMLFLTIFKFLTALVSCATAITLLTLIPMLLKVKVREFMLKKKTWDLGRAVGRIKKQKEAGWHVRMLTQEIRKSLDRHTILYTTLVELSKTLRLQNCAVWMPDDNMTEMHLSHELKSRSSYSHSIPFNDLDVIRIKENHGVNVLNHDSALGIASSGESSDFGEVAAIRMPMLNVSNFKGGTPELFPACYAVLVLVLPNEHSSRSWSDEELEIVQVVADQVAVALSHAAVLEESQLMRDKLEEQNRALQNAKRDALMASQARNSSHKVMGNGMRRPMHPISGLLSIMQEQDLKTEQQVIVNAMVKSSNVLSTLMNDVMEISAKDNGRFILDVKSFGLHKMIKEAASLAKCLCVNRGFDFSVDVERSLPDLVAGDERRVFQVILHMFGNLMSRSNGEGGFVTFRVFKESGSEGGSDQRWASWKSNLTDGYVFIRFEIGIQSCGSQSVGVPSNLKLSDKKYTSDEEALSFSMCRQLVQLMQGNIWSLPTHDFSHIMALVLRFQLQPPGRSNFSDSSDHPHSNTLFRGLQVLLAADDDLNRAVTRKLLEKLGCTVSAVMSGSECLNAIGQSSSSPFRIVVLDLFHMLELDGFEVAMKIRKFRSRSWPLIIALTSSADEEMWEKCLQVGINGVVRKPVLLRGIADEFRRVLQQSGTAV